MAVQRVGDLTVEELKRLIREVVWESLQELLSDPNAGLELRPEVRERLQHSLSEQWSEENTFPVEEVARRLGLER